LTAQFYRWGYTEEFAQGKFSKELKLSVEFSCRRDFPWERFFMGEFYAGETFY